MYWMYIYFVYVGISKKWMLPDIQAVDKGTEVPYLGCWRDWSGSRAVKVKTFQTGRTREEAIWAASQSMIRPSASSTMQNCCWLEHAEESRGFFLQQGPSVTRWGVLQYWMLMRGQVPVVLLLVLMQEQPQAEGECWLQSARTVSNENKSFMERSWMLKCSLVAIMAYQMKCSMRMNCQLFLLTSKRSQQVYMKQKFRQGVLVAD